MKKTLSSLRENRILLCVLWIICLVLFLMLFFRYKTYKPMKKYYNKGVRCFKAYDYEEAELYFESALFEKKTKRQECRIRINEALSIVTPITPDVVNEDNLDEYIERLEYARDILVENDCAHMDDSNGHNKKAQTLKEEIDEYIKQLKEQNEKSEAIDEDNDEEENEKQKQAEETARELKNKKEQKLRETFSQIERQGLSERNSKLEEYSEWGQGAYFSGKSW